MEIHNNIHILCVGNRGYKSVSDGVEIIVDIVFMDKQKSRGDLDDKIDKYEGTFGFDLFLVGSYVLFPILLILTGRISLSNLLMNLYKDMALDRIRVKMRVRGGERGCPRYICPLLRFLPMMQPFTKCWYRCGGAGGFGTAYIIPYGGQRC